MPSWPKTRSPSSSALALALAVLFCGGCGAFASVSTEAPFLSLQPDFAYQGEKRGVAIRFPTVPASVIRASHFTELDFGDQILPSNPSFDEDGAIRVQIEVALTAPLGDRFVRVGIATDDGQVFSAAAVFHVLRPLR